MPVLFNSYILHYVAHVKIIIIYKQLSEFLPSGWPFFFIPMKHTDVTKNNARALFCTVIYFTLLSYQIYNCTLTVKMFQWQKNKEKKQLNKMDNANVERKVPFRKKPTII